MRLRLPLLLLLLVLTLSACVTGSTAPDTGLLVSGKAIDALGQQFVAAGKTYANNCVTQPIKPAFGVFCARFRAYASDFGRAYNPAVDTWKAAVAANDASKVAGAQAAVLQLSTDLLAITTDLLLQVK